ncbi:MAG: hypothetical protein F9K47_18045 [Burkholderiales bacterium]|nr:MAG: hypothetical protein F9K47_18045 [Burkholderiales bacterium]
MTGAARLYRAASSDRRERGRPQGWASLICSSYAAPNCLKISGIDWFTLAHRELIWTVSPEPHVSFIRGGDQRVTVSAKANFSLWRP